MTTYPFWIEHDENGNPINYLWVKIDNIPASQTKTIYVHTDGSNSPDGDSVFDFFDDFEGTSLNTSKWDLQRWSGSGSYSATVTNGYVEIYSGSGTNAGIVTKTSYNLPFIIQGLMAYVSGGEFWNGVTDVSGGADSDVLRVGYVSTPTFYYQKILGSITTYESLSRSLPSTFTPYKWVLTSTDAYYYESGSQVNTVTTQDLYSSESLYPEIYSRNDGTVRYDYLFVRKYTATEPSVSVTQIDSTTYKVDIINNETNDLTDYQVAIPLSELPDITSSTQTLDVISEEPSGETVYSYWIEHDESNNPQNYVWVKIDSLPASQTKTIYAIKESGFSPNGDNVFEFFDDFETSVNSSKWVENVHGSISVSNSILTLYCNTGNENTNIITVQSFNLPFVIDLFIKVDTSYTSSRYSFLGLPQGPWDTTSWLYWGHIYGSDDLLDVLIRDDTGATTLASDQQPVDSYIRATSKILSSKVLEYSDSEGFSGTHDFSGNSGLTFPSTFSIFTRKVLSDSKVYADWVLVRKYTATEPTITVTDMGTYYKIDITNNEASTLTGYQIAIPINDLGVTSTTESIKFTDTSPEQPSEVNKALHFSHNF